MNLIASADRNWAIGKNNELLVRVPEDMKFFRRMTTGKVVVMGRKTLESFPNQDVYKRQVVYTSLIDTSLDGNAFTAARMAGGLTKTGVGEDIGYSIDRGYSNITEQGTNEWARYESIGAVSTYTADIMDGEDRDAWDKAYNDIYQWWGTVLPTMIKDGVTDESWNSMVDKLRNDFNLDQVTEIAQKYIDEIQPR